MKQGLLAIRADKEWDTAEAVRFKALAFAKRRKELVKLGLSPGDPLMQVPKGPGLS
jgi:hypothetical protein